MAATWFQNNEHYDPLYTGATSTTANSPATDIVDIADTVRKSLLHNLQSKPGQHCDEVGSQVSGVSIHTGDDDSIGGSMVQTEDTIQCTLI